jgi:hypothetical protein
MARRGEASVGRPFPPHRGAKPAAAVRCAPPPDGYSASVQTMPGAAPPRLVPGSVIGERYEIGPLLGWGGMAEVYAGTDRRLGRPVAVKLLAPEMAARPDVRSRFEAEARAAASLSHPNAVAVFDTGEHEGTPYIVMERLRGETLADRIAAGPLDPGVVRAVAEEVLGALGAAHATGLVHRDVKPANILLTADGQAKVADFGIAKSAEAASGGDLTGTGQLLGTPAYLAPERIDGAPATPRSDLWAVGVVLYEALSGTRAFIGETPLATARAVAAGAHRPLAEVRPGLDPALAAAVERAMDPDPSRRVASAEMAAALRNPTGAGVAAAAPTAVLPAGGDTLVLGGAELAGDAPRPAGPGRRALLWGVLAAFAVVLAVLLLARAADDGSSPPVAPGASTATTAAPAITQPPGATVAPPTTPAPAVTAPPATAPRATAPPATAAPTTGDGDGEGGGEDGEEGGEGRGNGRGKNKD